MIKYSIPSNGLLRHSRPGHCQALTQMPPSFARWHVRKIPVNCLPEELPRQHFSSHIFVISVRFKSPFSHGLVTQQTAILRNMREAVPPRTEDDLKRVYEKFIDSVEVFEGYVTVAFKILPIMGIRRKIRVSRHEKKPPLGFNQMGAWNGGTCAS